MVAFITVAEKRGIARRDDAVLCCPRPGTIDATDTPRPIVGRLNREVRDILALPDIKLKLVEGGNIAIPSTPDEMRVRTASDMTRWRHVIEAANIQTE